MGVADNISYKDVYPFNNYTYRNNGKDLPSLNVDPEVNDTIHKNPYKANVNIEKGEVVLNPQLDALFKARGKKHYDGGIDVFLKPNSFVFSDDKTLALTPEDHKTFELKMGGNKLKMNTPSSVLKRNIDVKHYNQLINNISDVKKDELAKKSSTRMLEKYVNTLGNIAYLQEHKKGFPDGLPSFSDGTAPVYSNDIKDQMMQEKQYAKFGGKIMAYGGPSDPTLPWNFNFLTPQQPVANNPYGFTPQYNGPVTVPSEAPPITTYPGGRTQAGSTTPTGVNNAFNYPGGVQGYIDAWKKVGVDISPNDPNDVVQRKVYEWNLKNNPAAIQQMWNKYGNTAKGRTGNIGTNLNFQNIPTDQLPNVENAYVDGKFGIRQLTPPAPQVTTPTTTPAPVPAPVAPVPNGVTGPTDNGRTIDWQFTPWQKASHAYNLFKLADTQRYMPMRSHLNASYVNPYLVNPEQAIEDTNAAAYGQTAALNTLNPIMRNAQASQIYGQQLQQNANTNSQYDNQNAEIKNQFAQYNNQTRNTTALQNMQNDANYYQQTIVGRQNFDNMKSYLGDQYMNNMVTDASTDQGLAYKLLTQNNPAYGYDFRTGNFYRNHKDIRDVPGELPENAIQQEIQFAQRLKQSGIPDAWGTAILKGRALQNMAPFLGNTPMQDAGFSGYKKGGRVRPSRNPFR